MLFIMNGFCHLSFEQNGVKTNNVLKFKPTDPIIFLYGT